MSKELNVNHELLDEHLAQVDLKANDFAILGVRPTETEGWVQVAVAQKVVRDNDISEDVVKGRRINFRIGRGDDRISGNKPRRAWDHLTFADVKVKYADTPEVIAAAETALKSDDYVLVSDDDGKPIINPTLQYGDMTLPYFIDIWEDHQPESDWSVKNMKRAAKQTPQGLYLYKNRGGTLVDGVWEGGKNYVIFAHTAVHVGDQSEALRDFMEHDGATSDISVLQVMPGTSASNGFNAIAGTPEAAQKRGAELDKEPTTDSKPKVGQPKQD